MLGSRSPGHGIVAALTDPQASVRCQALRYLHGKFAETGESGLFGQRRRHDFLESTRLADSGASESDARSPAELRRGPVGRDPCFVEKEILLEERTGELRSVYVNRALIHVDVD